MSGSAAVGAAVLNPIMQWQQNQWNAEQMRQQNQWNIEQWQRENAYNSPAAQMARLRAAGINPALAFSQGQLMNEAAASPAMQASQGKAPQLDPSLFAQLEVLDAQAEDLRASAAQRREETKGQEISNEVGRMNADAFKSSYEEGLVHAAKRAGLYREINDARLSQYSLFENAWNFAILTGVSLSDALTESDMSGVDMRDTSTNKSVPFAFTKEAYEKARSLFIGGRDAQIWANKAAQKVAEFQYSKMDKNVDIYDEINKLSDSDKWLESLIGKVLKIGLFIAEERFALPSINLNIDSGKKFNYYGFGADDTKN